MAIGWRHRYRLAVLPALGLAAMLGAANAFGQSYPYKPIRYIVPFAAGGATDIITRILAQPLTESLGQQVVVDNRPGAGAIIGTSLLAKAPADGYTIIMCEIAHGANPALHAKLPYDTRKDFVPIAWAALIPTVLVVPPTLPIRSVQELIEQARAKPGHLNYASSGVGSANFLAAELFKSELGLDIVHIPYQGGGQAVAAVLSGQAQMLFVTLPPSLPHVKAGRLRVLAISSGKRVDSLPGIQTIAETTGKPIDISLWLGSFAPAGTPPAVVQRLNAEINKALALPTTRERMQALGAEPVGGSSQKLAELVDSEIERWTRTIKPIMRAK